MILLLQVPFLETFSHGGTITRWHVAEGDLLEFGDAICEVALSEWMALRKTKRALNLVRIRDHGQTKVKHNFELRKGRGVLVMRIVASESCYVRRLDADVGKRVKVGDLLGLVSTEPDDLMPADPSGAPTMRVVAVSGDVREEAP
jgi:pyruvate/2-oxoglutarate dehydrogenase complex dihydrolipoamide acyltransferase (E2) component